MTEFALTHPDDHKSAMRESDYYPTPRHAIVSLLENYHLPFPAMPILDPCAGDGAICRVLQEYKYTAYAIEIREECRKELEASADFVVIGDCLTEIFKKCSIVSNPYSVITNPPFRIAREIIISVLDSRVLFAAFLLRCDVIGSGPWADLWNEYTPTAIRPLRKRPKFRADKKGTDFSNYAWFIWDSIYEPIDMKVC